MGYSKEVLEEFKEDGWVSLEPDMTEIFAKDKRYQQLLKRQNQYEKNSEKWNKVQKKIDFRKKTLKFKGSNSNQKLKTNQVVQGYFDQGTGKGYINNKEVSQEEYLKFQGMTNCLLYTSPSPRDS